MTSMNKKQRTQERLERIDEAITNLKKGKQKLSISKIATKAGIARKTIYNNTELKERCDQAIEIESISGGLMVGDKRISYREKMNQRYVKVDQNLKKEKEKNAILLENNRQLVLEKSRLLAHIDLLQQKIETMTKQKVTRFPNKNE